MFKTIVLATDLSPAWNEIVACAGEFKALGCSQVILTNVIVARLLSGLEEMLRADVRPKLEAQQRQLEAQGLQVKVEMPVGLPAHSLNEVAGRHEADLIVLGSHGTALWREAVLGCFTSAVVHHTKYPTLLINVRVKKDQEADPCRLHCGSLLRHVLFPTDFSEVGVRAGESVEILATRGIGQVTLLTALDVPGRDAYPPGYQEIAEGAVQGLAGAMAAAPLESRDSRSSRPLCPGASPSGHSPGPGISRYFLNRHGHPGEGFYQGAFSGKRGP